MSARRVDPELLDELPAADPRAAASRADLRRLNGIMGHAPILARLWREALGDAASPSGSPPARPEHAVEFGAGDGTLALRLLHRLPLPLRPRRVTLVDRQDLLTPETRAGYHAIDVTVAVERADVFAWLAARRPFDVALANLFLHHFEPPALRELLAGIAGSARALIAVEPRRSTLAAAASRGLGLIGCHAVTRHDAVVSVRAGFAGRELSALWPSDPQPAVPQRSSSAIADPGSGSGPDPGPGSAARWALSERRAGLFSHAFVASRSSAS